MDATGCMAIMPASCGVNAWLVTHLTYHILYTHKLNTPTGFPCEEHENPADYFLDVVNRCEKRAQLTEAEGQLLVCVVRLCAKVNLAGVYTLLLCRLRGHINM